MNLYEVGLEKWDTVDFSLPSVWQLGYFKINSPYKIKFCIPSESGILFYSGKKISNEIYRQAELLMLRLWGQIKREQLFIDILDFSIEANFSKVKSALQDNFYEIGNQIDFGSYIEELTHMIYENERKYFSRFSDIESYNSISERKIPYRIIALNIDNLIIKPSELDMFVKIFPFFKKMGISIIGIYSDQSSQDELKILLLKCLKERTSLIEKKDKELYVRFINQDYTSFFKGKHIYCCEYDELQLNDYIDQIKNDEERRVPSEDYNFLEIPIAVNEDKTLYLRMGEKDKKYGLFMCGLSSSGKSTLLKNMLKSIALNYSSDEIKVSIFDFKNGVDFYRYSDYPNVRMMCGINDSSIVAKNIIKAFDVYMEDWDRRTKLLSLEGVNRIEDYNRTAVDKLSYELLVIDEIRSIYDSMDNRGRNELNSLFTKLLSQGRFIGYNVIFCTQNLDNFNMEKQILSWVTNRISFKLNREEECRKVLTEGNNEPIYLGKYEIIFNDDCGKNGFNQRGYTYKLTGTHDEIVTSARNNNAKSKSFDQIILKNNYSDIEPFSLREMLYNIFGQNCNMRDKPISNCVVTYQTENEKSFLTSKLNLVCSVQNNVELNYLEIGDDMDMLYEISDEIYYELLNRQDILNETESENYLLSNLYQPLYKFPNIENRLYIIEVKMRSDTDSNDQIVKQFIKDLLIAISPLKREFKKLDGASLGIQCVIIMDNKIASQLNVLEMPFESSLNFGTLGDDMAATFKDRYGWKTIFGNR